MALSMVNGMRTALPATPKVGASRLSSSTSGSLVGLPTGTVKTGMPFIRSLEAARTGGCPSFQSPSEARTTPRRLGIVSRPWPSGSFRSVPCPSPLGENGWMTTCILSPSAFQDSGRVSGSIASRRVSGWAEVCSPRETSRVSMLGEASQRTTIDAFSSGRILLDPLGLIQEHRREADAGQPEQLEDADRPLESAPPPGDEAEPGRRRAIATIDRPIDQGVARKVSDRVAFIGRPPAELGPTLGRQRPASTTIATIMRDRGTAARSPGSASRRCPPSRRPG